MKVVLSNKIYLKPDEELIEHLANQLTYKVFEQTNLNRPPRLVKHFGPVANGVWWIPNERMDLLQHLEDVEVVDKRCYVPVNLPTPGFTLREEQAEVVNEVDDSCLLNAKPGWGKSIAGLAIAHKLGQKTLIVCTTLEIRRMWEQEIEKWFGFKPDVIGSGKFGTDTDIVVANIQTLRKHGLKVSSIFGLVIFDECHHTPASTFTQVLMESKARYKIGLSGTVKRKDGLESVFKDFFGFKMFQPAVANTLEPTIHLFDSQVDMSGNQTIPWALKVNAVLENPRYRKFVVALTNAYAAMGHKVLLVSDRVSFLEHINEENNMRSELFIGATDNRDDILQKMTDNELDVLCASQSIFSEGVSQNNLSCLILASPIGNNEALIEQLAGRIQRMYDGKLAPVIVDIALGGSTGKRHRQARIGVYSKNGWQCEGMNLQSLVNKNKNALAKFLEK